jgi:hypothetical protein
LRRVNFQPWKFRCCNPIGLRVSFTVKPHPADCAHGHKIAAAKAGDDRKVQEMEREIMDLKIANRGKDYLIDQLNKERTGFFEKLLSATRTVGQLETKLLHLGAPKSED